MQANNDPEVRSRSQSAAPAKSKYGSLVPNQAALARRQQRHIFVATAEVRSPSSTTLDAQLPEDIRALAAKSHVVRRTGSCLFSPLSTLPPPTFIEELNHHVYHPPGQATAVGSSTKFEFLAEEETRPRSASAPR